MPVTPAKTHIARPRLVHINVLDFFAAGIKDRHAMIGQINIPLVVNGHAVRAHLAKQMLSLQRAVSLNVITISLVVTDVGHIQHLPVRRADDAIWLFKIIDDADRLRVPGRKIIDALAILLLRPALPIRARIIRVRDVESAAGPNPDIIRPVEKLPVVVLQHDRLPARWINPPKFIFFIRAGPKISLFVERKPVGPPARLHEHRQFAIRAPFENPVARLVGEENVAFGVASRAFGELKTMRQLLQTRALGNEIAFRRPQ